jgi:hypothetical protein
MLFYFLIVIFCFFFDIISRYGHRWRRYLWIERASQRRQRQLTLFLKHRALRLHKMAVMLKIPPEAPFNGLHYRLLSPKYLTILYVVLIGKILGPDYHAPDYQATTMDYNEYQASLEDLAPMKDYASMPHYASMAHYASMTCSTSRPFETCNMLLQGDAEPSDSGFKCLVVFSNHCKSR